MPCYSPLKGYKDEETGGLKFRRDNTKETMDVACGQCIGCRLDRSRMWAMRMVHEASLHESTNGSSFVTLTYRDKKVATEEQRKNGWHIPDDWSLRKEDVQKFLKRLRKALPKEQKIKYYHCGEYGSVCKHGFDLTRQECPLCNLGRPHYHICLFNCSFSDLEAYAVQNGTTRYTSPALEETWKHGFVDVGDLTMQSAGYVARYVLKKITGKQAEDHYQAINPDGEVIALEPEYATMSNGLGKGWYEKYSSDVFPSDEVPVPTVGVIKKAPRYYEQMYKESDPVGWELMKAKRVNYRRENEKEYAPERLLAKYKIKKRATETLKRGMNE
ncbi:putative replication initiation protein [Eel River basin pequenovirus]|nr:putative replication initiation protein [Eel River basin pequenovirus]